MEGSLTLVNDVTELKRLADWVSRLGREFGLSAEDVFALTFALEEITTNVMKYGYGEGVDLPITIRYRMGDGEMEIEVEDLAEHFNPLEANPPPVIENLAEAELGGWGIHLTRQMMDEMSYSRREGKNVLTMIKKLGSESNGAGKRGEEHGD